MEHTQERELSKMQQLKVYFYAFAGFVIIISRILGLFDWNIGMSLASIALAITLFIDAYSAYDEHHKLAAFANGFLGVIIVIMIVLLWLVL
ncbi:hypothetical protein A4S06_01000 [Erysipelotrichaceae bacterium MTC7]|nr:hypothetical protein A4S06_01000 [Erysipelotrichaceae bacterium MTC7]